MSVMNAVSEDLPDCIPLRVSFSLPDGAVIDKSPFILVRLGACFINAEAVDDRPLIATNVQSAIDADDQQWLRKNAQMMFEFAEYATRLHLLFSDDDLRARLVRNVDEREDMGTLKPIGLRAV